MGLAGALGAGAILGALMLGCLYLGPVSAWLWHVGDLLIAFLL